MEIALELHEGLTGTSPRKLAEVARVAAKYGLTPSQVQAALRRIPFPPVGEHH